MLFSLFVSFLAFVDFKYLHLALISFPFTFSNFSISTYFISTFLILNFIIFTPFTMQFGSSSSVIKCQQLYLFIYLFITNY